MEIHESAEDYLETILMLKQRLGVVRSIDIVNELGYKKSSVSVAMKRLRENDYIRMDQDGYITLNPSGLEIAQRIYERHQLLTKVLVHLGVSPEVAAADACKLEHAMSAETFARIKEYALREKAQNEEA